MKIVKVTFNMPYRYGDTAEKAETDRQSLINAYDELGIKYDPDTLPEVFCTAEVAVELFSKFPRNYIDVGVEKVMTVFDGVAHMREQMDAVLNRMNIAAARLETQVAIDGCADMNPGHRVDGAGWNQHANSPISGPVLHSFNETMLCEDCCTDSLQNHLMDGWRVIAVCPQESRRPDYVLARCNQNTMARQALRG